MSRALQAALVVANVLFLGIPVQAAEASSVQLVLDSARYEASTSKLHLSIKARNGTTDPVSILKPSPELVDKDRASSAISYVGVGERPYKLSIVQTGKCGTAPGAAAKTQPRAAIVTKHNIAFLAPNAEMDLGGFVVDVEGVVFCKEAKFAIQIAYEPAFTLPAPEATGKIDAYIKARTMNPEAIRPLFPPDAKFLAEMGFLPENANLFSGAQEEPPSIERYVASVKLMEASAKGKIVSNTLVIGSGSDKAKVSETGEEAPKGKAKTTRK